MFGTNSILLVETLIEGYLLFVIFAAILYAIFSKRTDWTNIPSEKLFVQFMCGLIGVIAAGAYLASSL